MRLKRDFLFILLILSVYGSIAQEPKLMLPIGHTDIIISANFSSDGRFITTCGGNVAKIWDSYTGKLIHDLQGHDQSVLSSEFSSDGKLLSTGSKDGSVKVWEVISGKLIKTIGPFRYGVRSAKFSHDAKYLAIIFSLSKLGVVWNVALGKIEFGLEHKDWILSAEFSKKSEQLVTSSADGNVIIWDIATGFQKKKLAGHTNKVLCANFSPDSDKIVTASLDNTAKVWDVKTGEIAYTLNKQFNNIFSVKFSCDGKLISTLSHDGTADLWQSETGKLLFSFGGSTDRFVNSIEFNPNCKSVLIGFRNNNDNIILDLNNGKSHLTMFKYKINGYYGPIKISPDGKIALEIRSMSVRIWDLNSGKYLYSLRGALAPRVFDLSPDGNSIIISYNDNIARIWDKHSGRLLQNLYGHTDEIYSSFYTSDGNFIVTIGQDFKAIIWNAISGKLLFVMETDDSTRFIESVDFSNDYKLAKICFYDRKPAKVYSSVSGKLLYNFKNVRYSQFSPNGKLLAMVTNDNSLLIADALTGKTFQTLDGTLEYVYSLKFSYNGKYIVTHEEGGIKIWDVGSGKLKYLIKGYADDIGSIEFSPNGIQAITTYIYHDTAKILDVNSGALLFTINNVNEVQFNHDGSHFLTSAFKKNEFKVWNAVSGNLVCTLDSNIKSANQILTELGFDFSMGFDFLNGNLLEISNNEFRYINNASKEVIYKLFVFNSSDYIVIDKNYHYDGTVDARKLLYFTCGTEVIEIDQLKDQLWVPNLVERIMKGDSINAKTLADINICGLIPQVEDRSTELRFHFEIKPRRGGLGETVVYVNGIEARRYKPAQLKKSLSAGQAGGEFYELVLAKTELSSYFIAGKENPVTVKAYTADNAISSRGIIINEDKTNEKTNAPPKLYAVMVGVSDYKDDELDLKYAAKDANDISNAVAAAARKLLNTDGKEHVFVYDLTTAEKRYQLPEKNSIKKVLEEIGKKATANDILLIFFAGHGVMSARAGEKQQFYFLTADASKTTAASAVADVGISTAELTEWMKPQNIKAQKRILIFDACNSGQAIRDLVKVGNEDQGYMAARNDEQSQQIKAIDKLNEQSGFFILSASASNQSAYEMGRYSQGLLTYSLLKAIKQQPDILEQGKYLDVSRWFSAAEKTVTELTKETGARQQPQIISNTNFNIGIVDEEVMAKIMLPQEKPLFTNSNLQNADENIAYDDKELSKLLDAKLSDISARGADGPIVYTPNLKTEDVWILSGRYDVKGNTIIARINIRQGKAAPKHKFELSGTTDKLNELATAIAAKAVSLIQ